MNKYQEALEYMLELERLYWDDSGLVADQRFIDNFELLQELVDKATPMKPPKHDKVVCPTCNSKANYGHPYTKYCCHCGQMLDLSKDE